MSLGKIDKWSEQGKQVALQSNSRGKKNTDQVFLSIWSAQVSANGWIFKFGEV